MEVNIFDYPRSRVTHRPIGVRPNDVEDITVLRTSLESATTPGWAFLLDNRNKGISFAEQKSVASNVFTQRRSVPCIE
jgi:hypothetical protein